MDDPEQREQPKPNFKRTGRLPLFSKIIDTLTRVRDVLEAEVVKEQEKLNQARERQGGRRG